MDELCRLLGYGLLAILEVFVGLLGIWACAAVVREIHHVVCEKKEW